MTEKKQLKRPAKDVRDYYALDSVQPFLPELGMRLIPEIAGAFGYRDIVHIADGFDMVVGDVRHEKPASIKVSEGATLKLHFRLSGTGRARLDGEERIDIPDRCCALLLHPDGINKREWFFAGQHEQSVTLLCTGKFLGSRIADIAADLPSDIRDFLRDEVQRSTQLTMPLRADMARAAASLLACELSGSLRSFYAEAKAYELLSLGLQSLIDIEAGQERRDSGLTARDIEKLHNARRILEEQFLEPPKIAELAKSVGLNEAKLMRSFKQVFGPTIFDFSQQLRMELAKKLIEATDMSVTEIALEVGYEYSSNFTTAFKRHFGITPKAARDAANL
ncbi:MAG: AraC family transcriptional regulator [Gammaproteobacteria bacterium]|nr:AraC family transcriptional regulator [Gammaproteobacteria bacterium]